MYCMMTTNVPPPTHPLLHTIAKTHLHSKRVVVDWNIIKISIQTVCFGEGRWGWYTSITANQQRPQGYWRKEVIHGTAQWSRARIYHSENSPNRKGEEKRKASLDGECQKERKCKKKKKKEQVMSSFCSAVQCSAMQRKAEQSTISKIE